MASYAWISHTPSGILRLPQGACACDESQRALHHLLLQVMQWKIRKPSLVAIHTWADRWV